MRKQALNHTPMDSKASEPLGQLGLLCVGEGGGDSGGRGQSFRYLSLYNFLYELKSLYRRFARFLINHLNHFASNLFIGHLRLFFNRGIARSTTDHQFRGHRRDVRYLFTSLYFDMQGGKWVHTLNLELTSNCQFEKH